MSRHISRGENNNHSNDSSNESDNQKNSMHGKSQKSLHEQKQPFVSPVPEEQQPEEVVVRQVGLGKNAEGFQRTVMKSPTKHNSSDEIARDEDDSSSSSHSSVSPMSSEKNPKNNVPVKRPLMQIYQKNGLQAGQAEEQKRELIGRSQIMAAALSMDDRYENKEINGMSQHNQSLYENLAAQQHLSNDIIHQHITRDRERIRQNSLSKQFSSSQLLLKTSSNGGVGGFYNDLSLSHENNNGFISNANNENSLMMNAPPPQSYHQHWPMIQNNSFGSNEEHYQYQNARRMSQSNVPPSLFQNNSSQSQSQQQQQLSKNFHNAMTTNYNMGPSQSSNIQNSFEFGTNFGMKQHYEHLHGNVSGGSTSGFPPLVSLISPRPQQQTQSIMNESGGGGAASASQTQNMGGFSTNNNYNSYQNHQQSNMIFNNPNNNAQHSPFDTHNYHKYLSIGRGGMGMTGIVAAANDNNFNHQGTNNNSSAHGMIAVPPSHLQEAIGSNTSQYEDNQIIAGSSLSPNLIAPAAASTNGNMLHQRE